MLSRMSDKCLELQIKSGKCSDDFYRTLKLCTTEKRTSRQIITAGKQCSSLASIYDNSLDKLLACLRMDEQSESEQKRIEETLEYRRLLMNDIELIPLANSLKS
jgi:hypothetical protein